MKRGVLYEVQAEAGAAFAEYDGWELAAEYGSGTAELETLQARVGLVDWTGWGVVQLTGGDRLDFVQRMSTNDVGRLRPGEGAATVLTTPIGRIVDMVCVGVREEELLLLVGRGADEVVAGWLGKHIFFNDEVVVERVTEQWGLMGCMGPEAGELMARLIGPGVRDMAPFQTLEGQVEGVEVSVMRSAPWGSGYLLLVGAAQAAELWTTLRTAVERAGGAPVGERALETARVSAGWPRFGRELSEDYIPLEAGLKWAISFTKGCYVGQEVIARMDTYQRLAKRLVVLDCGTGQDPAAVGLAPGAEVRGEAGKVGQVTSVAPLADRGVLKGLAYVKTGAAEPGRELSVAMGDGRRAARVLAVAGEG
jgi:folate-binding protein YgfZ